jgi:Putative MetA-pathway of phenol degradation
MKRFYVVIFSLLAMGVNAQSLTDGLMMPKGNFCTGFLYMHDQWKDYWEGGTRRENANIGTITTQSLMYMGNYGVTDRLNIIVMLPYVKTQPSSGTLTGMEGIQDVSLSAKYRFLAKDYTASGLRFFAVGTFSTPASKYTADFLPMSIGLGSTNFTARLTGNYHLESGWYINASGGYTVRSNVKLDRPSYYSDGQIYFTNEVNMYDTFDFTTMLGYYKNGIQAEAFYAQQNTLGGGDIRRQDMPFVSNRMNYGKVGALLMYYLPKPKNLAVRASFSYTLDGRNVGQSTTLMGGLLYTFHFASKNETFIPKP